MDKNAFVLSQNNNSTERMVKAASVYDGDILFMEL